MKSGPEKPVRYGITPVGLMYLGFFVILAVAMGFTRLFDLARWFIRWIHGGG